MARDRDEPIVIVGAHGNDVRAQLAQDPVHVAVGRGRRGEVSASGPTYTRGRGRRAPRRARAAPSQPSGGPPRNRGSATSATMAPFTPATSVTMSDAFDDARE